MPQYKTLEDTIGGTPLVRLQRLGAADNDRRGNVIHAKLEGNNPAGSVKDRPAISMIRRAGEPGYIEPVDTLRDARWGNTGRALAQAAGSRRSLKEKNAAIRIIGAQPSEGSRIPGIRKWPEAYLPKIYDPKAVDEMVLVAQADAEEMARRLSRDEGLFAGISSGGACWVALQI